MVDWASFNASFWRIICRYRDVMRWGFVFSVAFDGVALLVLPLVQAPGAQVIAALNVFLLTLGAVVFGIALAVCRRRE